MCVCAGKIVILDLTSLISKLYKDFFFTRFEELFFFSINILLCADLIKTPNKTNVLEINNLMI